MDFQKLRPFLEKTAATGGLALKKQANQLLDQVMSNQQHEQVVEPKVTAKGPGALNTTDAPKDEVDNLLEKTMPDIVQLGNTGSTFGKVASAFIADVLLGDLPKATQEDILKLLPDASKKARVTQYGMVVDEILPKVDKHNFSVAEAHTKEKMAKLGKKALGDEFQKKVGDKYILLLNDQVIDAHHFLALAKILGITCSLKVLDLNPLRFQEKKASLLNNFTVKKYGSHNHSRPGSLAAPRHPGSPRLPG